MNASAVDQAITFKILVVGAFGIGKTTLIQQISEVPVVGTEVTTTGREAEVKPTTTVGVEYGLFSVGDPEAPITLLLFGTPGQERFSVVRDVAATGLDGLIVLIDGTDPDTWPSARRLYRTYNPAGSIPTLVAVNRWRAGGAPPPEVARELDLHPDRSCVAAGNVTDREDARRFLVELLSLILRTELEEEDQR